MKFFIIVSLILSFNANALEKVKFSLSYGSSNLTYDGISTLGSSFTIASELFLTEKYGLLAQLGSAQTQSGKEVRDETGRLQTAVSINNTSLAFGGFIYLIPRLRTGAGLSINSVSSEIYEEGGEKEANEQTYTGPFLNANYTHLFGNFLVGLDYYYSAFDKYTNSQLSLLLGLGF